MRKGKAFRCPATVRKIPLLPAARGVLTSAPTALGGRASTLAVQLRPGTFGFSLEFCRESGRCPFIHMPPVCRNFVDGGEDFGSDCIDPVDVEVKFLLRDQWRHSVDDERSADQDGAGCKMVEVSFRDGVVFGGAHEGSRWGAHPGCFSGLRLCFHGSVLG